MSSIGLSRKPADERRSSNALGKHLYPEDKFLSSFSQTSGCFAKTRGFTQELRRFSAFPTSPGYQKLKRISLSRDREQDSKSRHRDTRLRLLDRQALGIGMTSAAEADLTQNEYANIPESVPTTFQECDQDRWMIAMMVVK